jgi:hypothetical protein
MSRDTSNIRDDASNSRDATAARIWASACQQQQKIKHAGTTAGKHLIARMLSTDGSNSSVTSINGISVPIKCLLKIYKISSKWPTGPGLLRFILYQFYVPENDIMNNMVEFLYIFRPNSFSMFVRPPQQVLPLSTAHLPSRDIVPLTLVLLLF